MVVEFVGVSFAHSRAMRFFIVCHFGAVVTSVIQSTLSCRCWMRWTECRHTENDMRFATESSLHSCGCQGTNASDFITEQMQFIWIPTLQTTLFEHAKDSIHFGTHTSDKSTVEHFSAPKYFSTVKCNLKCFFLFSSSMWKKELVACIAVQKKGKVVWNIERRSHEPSFASSQHAKPWTSQWDERISQHFQTSIIFPQLLHLHRLRHRRRLLFLFTKSSFQTFDNSIAMHHIQIKRRYFSHSPIQPTRPSTRKQTITSCNLISA